MLATIATFGEAATTIAIINLTDYLYNVEDTQRVFVSTIDKLRIMHARNCQRASSPRVGL